MRLKTRYCATMDAKLLAKLDLAKGRVPRSLWIEEIVRLALAEYEKVEELKTLYGQGLVPREVRLQP